MDAISRCGEAGLGVVHGAHDRSRHQ
jgi:hypothetical protein